MMGARVAYVAVCDVCREAPDARYPVLNPLTCRTCGRYVCLACTLFGRHAHRRLEERSAALLGERA